MSHFLDVNASYLNFTLRLKKYAISSFIGIFIFACRSYKPWYVIVGVVYLEQTETLANS